MKFQGVMIQSTLNFLIKNIYKGSQACIVLEEPGQFFPVRQGDPLFIIILFGIMRLLNIFLFGGEWSEVEISIWINWNLVAKDKPGLIKF